MDFGPQTPLPLCDACLHEGRCKWLNQDAQEVARASKGVIHWKPDRELISSALLGNGLLVAGWMLSPFQAHPLQVRKHARELGGLVVLQDTAMPMPWCLLICPLLRLKPFSSLGLNSRVEGFPLKDSICLYSTNFESPSAGEVSSLFLSLLPLSSFPQALTSYSNLKKILSPFAFCH